MSVQLHPHPQWFKSVNSVPSHDSRTWNFKRSKLRADWQKRRKGGRGRSQGQMCHGPWKPIIKHSIYLTTKLSDTLYPSMKKLIKFCEMQDLWKWFWQPLLLRWATLLHHLATCQVPTTSAAHDVLDSTYLSTPSRWLSSTIQVAKTASWTHLHLDEPSAQKGDIN